MSDFADGLSDLLSETLGQYLAEHGGGMVTGYAAIVNFMDADGELSWATVHADRQTPAETLGMLRFHTISVEQATIAYIRDDE